MITEPCPECMGRCCRNDLGYPLTHLNWDMGEHWCEHCHDGTMPTPVWTAEDERRATAAWLRDFGSGAWLENGGLSLVNLDEIADLFERGEHLKEKP